MQGFSNLHGFLLIAFYRLNLQKLLKFAILMSLIPLVLFPRKMESSILTQMSLCLILFYFNTGALCSVEDFHYRKINEIRDKIPVDEAIFSSVNSSPIRCVQRCIRSPNCIRVLIRWFFVSRVFRYVWERFPKSYCQNRRFLLRSSCFRGFVCFNLKKLCTLKFQCIFF